MEQSFYLCRNCSVRLQLAEICYAAKTMVYSQRERMAIQNKCFECHVEQLRSGVSASDKKACHDESAEVCDMAKRVLEEIENQLRRLGGG
mgnify:CR=1 FL=1